MSARIEEYALLGDTQTAALVSREGSVDWLCLPRFDSPACFAALLGRPEHGRFLLAPRAEPRRVERRYRQGTLVLETEYETADGVVTVVDAMPPRDRVPDLVRIVQGRHGHVRMLMELTVRFGYGQFAPWIERLAGDVLAVSGPEHSGSRRQSKPGTTKALPRQLSSRSPRESRFPSF